MTKLREQNKRVHKQFLLLLSNVEDLFLRPKKLLKTQNLRKKQPFQWRKDFVPYFLVLSNMTNVKEHFLKVQKLFWTKLWNL